MAKKKAPPHAGHRYRCSLPGLAEFTGRRWQDHKAERKGFEPPVPFGTHDFQSCTFDHSVTSPGGVRLPSSIDLHPGRGPLLFLNLSSKNLAESKGFEPLVPVGTLDFESSTFDRSVSSPRRKLAKRLGVSTTFRAVILGPDRREKTREQLGAVVR